MQLPGRIAVVTGAGSGIGAATAAALHRAGCKLALADINGESVRAVAATLPGASAHTLDVSDAGAVQAFADEVVKVHGGVNIVINNAGITVVGRFEQHSAEDWQRVVGVNLFGVVNGCRSFLPHLRAADRGWIVNISSMFGIVAFPGQSAYCASKFAVRGFTETLAEELAGSTVGVTVVHPGGVRTAIARQARIAAHAPQDMPVEQIARLFEERGVPPERVANGVVTAISREQARVRVCAETYLGDALKRLMPVLGNRLLISATRRMLSGGGKLPI